MNENSRASLLTSQFSWPKFLAKTWAGRILFVNGLVFLLTAYLSKSIFTSDQMVLWRLGAQDPVSLAQGEYWRYITPMFLHGGLIHFFFNSMAIFYVGRDLEPILGGKWFFLIYFLSGIGGSVASAVFSIAQSVGASGAIFGLIGSGLYLERAISSYIYQQTGEKPKRGPYMLMLLINLPISFLPMIDSNAHIGGVVTGFIATVAIMRVKENRLYVPNLRLAVVIMTILCGVLAYGGMRGLDADYISQRLVTKGDEATRIEEKIYHYSRALILEPENSELLFLRGSLLIQAGELNSGLADLIKANKDAGMHKRINDFILKLESEDKMLEVETLRKYFAAGTNI